MGSEVITYDHSELPSYVLDFHNLFLTHSSYLSSSSLKQAIGIIPGFTADDPDNVIIFSV